MKTNSIVMFFLVAATGCDPHQSAAPPDACDNEPCEEHAYVLARPLPAGGPATAAPIKLSVPERASLTAALAGSKATDSSPHIHADVANQQLVFSADQPSDPAAALHVSGNEPEISLTSGGPTQKVVATGPALQLLKKRAVR
jgi:hypothetical protein